MWKKRFQSSDDSEPEEPAEGGSDLEKELEEMTNKWMRAVAELDNTRKRARRDVEAVRKLERDRVIRGFLEVVDNFDRALNSADPQAAEWLTGFEGIRAQLIANLKTFGVVPFDALGEIFDPQKHEAIGVMRLPDKEENEIVEVLERGFMYEDGEMLRTAKVIVSK